MVIAIVALCARIFDSTPQDRGFYGAQTARYAESVRIEHVTAALSHPLPLVSDWLAMDTRRRMNGVLRCLGLSELRMRQACHRPDSTACRRARGNLADMQMSLWPKGRVGQLAVTFSERVQDYAAAYMALQNEDTGGDHASSQLILDRDGAICRRYRVFIEARLHGSETRKSG